LCLFNRRLSQAVLLTAAEVCALAPAEHGEDALRVSTLTGVSLFASWVRLAGLAVAGRFFGAETLLDWVDPSSNPLDRPELQELVTPVLRDLLVLLVPLLLPDCHGIPLPGSGSADPTGSKLSALLPQHIYLMVAAGVCNANAFCSIRLSCGQRCTPPRGTNQTMSHVQAPALSYHPTHFKTLAVCVCCACCVPPAAGKDILAQLLEEHPLWTTRALEAALRVDWAER
jgi:hypothetical protein